MNRQQSNTEEKQHDKDSPSRLGNAPKTGEQPEQGSPRSTDEKQIRGRSDIGSDRAQQNAGDSVTEAPEEA